MVSSKRISKKTIITIIVLVVALGVFAWMVRPKSPAADSTNQQQQMVTVEPSGITYPTGWSEQKEVSSSSKDQGVVSQAITNDRNSEVVVREQANTEGDSDLSALAQQIVDNLKGQINGFSLVKKDVSKYGTFDAIKIDYSVSNEQLSFNNRMIVVPAGSKVFYITYRSSKNLKDIDSDIKSIDGSVAKYIKDRKA